MKEVFTMTPETKTRVSTASAFPVLPAEDLARARKFYHDTLGFEVEDMPEGHQFMIHAGHDTRILVYERERTKATHTAAVLMVDDLSAAMTEMRHHGVRFAEYDMPELKTVHGVASLPNGDSAWFTDSEGNIISLTRLHH